LALVLVLALCRSGPGSWVLVLVVVFFLDRFWFCFAARFVFWMWSKRGPIFGPHFWAPRRRVGTLFCLKKESGTHKRCRVGSKNGTQKWTHIFGFLMKKRARI
jgi:hypothetical protein